MQEEEKPAKEERAGTFTIRKYADGRQTVTNESSVDKYLMVGNVRIDFKPKETKEIDFHSPE